MAAGGSQGGGAYPPPPGPYGSGPVPPVGPNGMMPPKPVRRGGGGAWWVWLLGGCGGLVLIIGLAFAYFVYSLSQNPALSRTDERGAQMRRVYDAVASYRQKSGKYPPNLNTLVPKYLPDKSLLAIDPAGTGSPVPIEYTPPVSGTPDDAVLLSVPTGTLIDFGPQNQRIYLRVLKSGRLVMDQVVRTDFSGMSGR